MSELTNLTATREALHELARIVKITRQTLAQMMQTVEQLGWLPHNTPPGQLVEALGHVEDVREGFIFSQRASPQITLSELQALVRHVFIDWQWIQELDIILTPGSQVETLGQQLVAYNHALVALAVLPRLPAQAVTFPQPKPTYHDVDVPVLPVDLLARIEEIEQMIYQADLKPINTLAYAPLRRTYAFLKPAVGWPITIWELLSTFNGYYPLNSYKHPWCCKTMPVMC